MFTSDSRPYEIRQAMIKRGFRAAAEGVFDRWHNEHSPAEQAIVYRTWCGPAPQGRS